MPDNRYALARSICNAVAWDPALVQLSIEGNRVPEIEQRCAYLEIQKTDRGEILDLALNFCNALSQSAPANVRVVVSRPNLVNQTERLWTIGQEWLEMIRGAMRSILVIAPSLDAAAVMNLREALVAAYNADVSLTILYGTLGRAERIRSAVDMIRSFCPKSELIQWPNTRGFLHAKAICVDESTVYVGSANLTEFGWEKNVEIGLTLSDAVAQPLISYCTGLVVMARSHWLNGQSRHHIEVAP